MDLTATFDAPCPSSALYPWLDDLGSYPRWLGLVARAVEAPAEDGDPGPAWSVDLRGRLGPLARSKRLRMVRALHRPPLAVSFERLEHDGRSHSPWVLDVEVDDVEGGSRLTTRLHYGGGLFGPLLERILAEEIARARPRLLALVRGDAAP